MPLLLSIGAFLPGLFGKRVAPKVAKTLGILLLALTLIGVGIIGKRAYDASLIEQNRAEVRAERAESILKAERAADAQAIATEAELAQTKAELDEATRKAAQRDPEGAAAAVGPVTQSYYDTLRHKESSK